MAPLFRLAQAAKISEGPKYNVFKIWKWRKSAKAESRRKECVEHFVLKAIQHYYHTYIATFYLLDSLCFFLSASDFYTQSRKKMP